MLSRHAVGVVALTALSMFIVSSEARVCDAENEPCLRLSAPDVRPSMLTYSISWDRYAEWCEVRYSPRLPKGLECQGGAQGKVDRVIISSDSDVWGLLFDRSYAFKTQLKRPSQPIDNNDFYFFRKFPKEELTFSFLDGKLSRGNKQWARCSEEVLMRAGQCIVPCEYDDSKACGIRYQVGHKEAKIFEAGTYFVMLSGFGGPLGYYGYTAAFKEFKVFYSGQGFRGYLGKVIDAYGLATNILDFVSNLDFEPVKSTVYDIWKNPLSYLKYINIPFVENEKEVDEKCELNDAEMCQRMFHEFPQDAWLKDNSAFDATDSCQRVVDIMADAEFSNRWNIVYNVLNVMKVVNKEKCMARCMARWDRMLVSLDSKCRAEDGMPGPVEQEMMCLGDPFSEVLGGDLVEKIFPGKNLWTGRQYVGWDEEQKDSISYSFEKEDSSQAILNFYRPEWLTNADWKSFCDYGTAFCIPPLCGSMSPCIPKDWGHRWDEGNTNVKIVKCTYQKKPENWLDALTCVERVINDAGFSPDEWRVDVKRRILDRLTKFWERKGVTACLMNAGNDDHEEFKLSCRGNAVKDIDGKDNVLDGGNRALKDRMTEWWVHSPIQKLSKCAKEPYMSAPVHACLMKVGEALQDIRTHRETLFMRGRIHSAETWLLTDEAQQAMQAGYEKLADEKARKEKYSAGMIFSDFVRNEEAPRFLSSRLVQEVSDYVWEVNSARCEPTLEQIYFKAGLMQLMFNTNNLHLHVVFPRPESDCCDCSVNGKGCYNADVEVGGESFYCHKQCRSKDVGSELALEQATVDNHAYKLNEYMGSLVSHMNDYAAFGHYQYNTNNKYLMVFNNDLVMNLRKAIAFGADPLDSIEDKTGGHSWGSFKKAFIALRHGIYGNPQRIGFEFRGGVSPALKVSQIGRIWEQEFRTSNGCIDYEHSLFISNIVNFLRTIKINDDSYATTPLQLSVKNHLKDDPRRKRISLADIDDFQTNARRVGWEYLTITGGEQSADGEFSGWCSGPKWFGNAAIAMKFKNGMNLNHRILDRLRADMKKKVESWRRSMPDTYSFRWHEQWKCLENDRSDNCLVYAFSVSPNYSFDENVGAIQAEQEHVLKGTFLPILTDMIDVDETNQEDDDSQAGDVDDAEVDLTEMELTKRKRGGKNKGKGGSNKSKKLRVSSVEIVSQPVDPPVNPRGCIRIENGYQAPHDLLLFTTKVIAQQEGVPNQCEDDGKLKFSAVAKDILKDPKSIRDIFDVKRAEESIRRLCSEEGQCDLDIPNMKSCIQDIWYRWSFVILNMASWERFTTNDEAFSTSFVYRGIKYNSRTFNKERLYRIFFMSPHTRNCTRCAVELLEFVGHLGNTELNERFLEE